MISAGRTRPSTEIRIIEVKKLRIFFTISTARMRFFTEIRVVEV